MKNTLRGAICEMDSDEYYDAIEQLCIIYEVDLNELSKIWEKNRLEKNYKNDSDIYLSFMEKYLTYAEEKEMKKYGKKEI